MFQTASINVDVFKFYVFEWHFHHRLTSLRCVLVLRRYFFFCVIIYQQYEYYPENNQINFMYYTYAHKRYSETSIFSCNKPTKIYAHIAGIHFLELRDELSSQQFFFFCWMNESSHWTSVNGIFEITSCKFFSDFIWPLAEILSLERNFLPIRLSIVCLLISSVCVVVGWWWFNEPMSFCSVQN